MNLSQLRLVDYRAFADATIDLPATGIALIVGANNSGKTALLSAIDSIANIKQAVKRGRLGGGNPQILAAFSTSHEDRDRLFVSAPSPEEWHESQGFRGVRLRFEVPVENVDDPPLVDQVEVTDANGDFRVVGVNRPVSAGNRQAEAVNFEAVLGSGAKLAEYNLASVASGSIGDIFTSAGNQIAWVSDMLNVWRSGIYHFEALRTGTTRQTDSHGVRRLSPTGVDLPQALLHLKSNDDPAWDALVKIMQDVVPDVGTLATPVEGNQVSVAFYDPYLDAKQNVKDLGTGVEQILMTAYVGVRQGPGSVVIVEEPETNLHPAAQRALLRYIREWSQDKLFILATHSAVFLDETTGQNRVILVERSGGVATTREASTELQDVLLSLGIRLSDVLSADRVLLVEGETDADVLRTWFPELSVARGTAVAGMGGGDVAWDVDLYPKIGEVADRLERKVVAIRDRDELSDAVVERLEREGTVRVLRRRELENYLLDDLPALIRVLERQAAENPESRQEPGGAGELETVLRQTAERLKDAVVLKRVVASLANIRLIDRDDVANLVIEGPTLERLLAVVRGRLRSAEDVEREITEAWEEASEAVAEVWEDRWREIAPGAELLDAVWKAHGGSFEKGRDGLMIATETSEPPDEIREIVTRLLED